jgi:hypothetical protein
MVFRFFDAASAGNEILVDQHLAAGTGAVGASNGAFNAALGGGAVTDGSGAGTYTSLRDVFAQYGTVYLEVTVGGETLSPRTKLLSSAFAIGNHGPDGPCYDNANRFADCGNGTVTDTVSGLVWLKNPGCFGAMNFADANNTAVTLHTGQCGLTDASSAGDWRLPTKTEWATIVKSSCFPSSNGPTIPDTLGTGLLRSPHGLGHRGARRFLLDLHVRLQRARQRVARRPFARFFRERRSQIEPVLLRVAGASRTLVRALTFLVASTARPRYESSTVRMSLGLPSAWTPAR